MSHAFVRIEMSHSSREFHSERCYSLIAVMKGGQQSMNDKNNLGERFFFREATTSRYRSKLFLIYFSPLILLSSLLTRITTRMVTRTTSSYERLHNSLERFSPG